MSRPDFAALPPITLQAMTRYTGAVRSWRPVENVRAPAVAAILATVRGPVFVKGVPADHPQAEVELRQVAINAHLPVVCPLLLWHVDAGGWLLIGWEVAQGRPADYQSSADLREVVATMECAQAVQAPDEVELPTAVDLWGPYATQGDAELFDGTVLLHTGWAADDVLIGGSRTWVVNWTRPARGAGWIDPYLWALRLMEAGHTAAAAVEWACEVASWREADPTAVLAFGASVARMWHKIATERPAPWKLHTAVQAAELRAYLALESGKAAC